MTTLLQLLMLHGLFLALVLAAGRRRARGNLLLALLSLAISLLVLQAFLGWSGRSAGRPYLRDLFRPVWFSIGPLVYAYVVRWTGEPRPRATRWLVLPPLLSAALAVPAAWLAAPAPTVLETGVLIAFTALTGGCAWASLRRLRRLERDGVPPDVAAPPWRRAWLRWLMAALAAYAVLDLVCAVWFAASGGYPPVASLVSLGLLTALVYSIGLLVVLPDGLLARAPWPGRKYERSSLDPDAAGRRAAALERLMDDQKLWLDEDLGLEDLAARLGTSRHDLSQILNQQLDTTFHDYVNRFRVAEAKRMLLDAGSRRSILDIGFAAGFGSSASFYRAFRKHVGMAPRDFLAEAAGGAPERFERPREARR